jgi:outer membrane protein assembly factor BamB
MRKILLLGVTGVVLAACGGTSPPAPDDVLFLRSASGITLVRTQPKPEAVELTDAVPSTDWSTVVRAVRQGEDTRVTAHDASTGRELWSREVSGNLEVKVASEGGQMVALSHPRQETGYPVGRSSTTLVLTGEGMTEPRTITVDGNIEPEAFSTDGGSLFVVEYLPPRAPTKYRVRRLDLGTERIEGVFTVDAELQEAMRGTARVQAASPDGRRLYTLYSLDHAHGTHMFVHVLSLDEQWAHCVDLPRAFETSSEKAIGLSVSPDGSRLFVADAKTGAVAEVDTQALVVSRSSHVDFQSERGPVFAAAGGDGRLYLGRGTRLIAVDAPTLHAERMWDMEERITGIQAGVDGARLYVGQKHGIVAFETGTGRRLGNLAIGDLDVIDSLGTSTRLLSVERTEVTCAC